MNLQCIFTGWKTLLCLWLFRIRSWNACFCGFLNAGLQNDGRLLTPYKCACSTFIFKHRAFPSSVTTPSTGTITPCSILHPPLTKNTPRALIGWNLSHHKTHPPYMGIPTHWRRSLKHALSYIQTNADAVRLLQSNFEWYISLQKPAQLHWHQSIDT